MRQINPKIRKTYNKIRYSSYMLVSFLVFSSCCKIKKEVAVKKKNVENEEKKYQTNRVRICSNETLSFSFKRCRILYLIDGEVAWLKTDDLKIFGDPEELWMPTLYNGEKVIGYRRVGRRLIVNGLVKSVDLQGLDGRSAAALIKRYKKSIDLVMFSRSLPKAALEALEKIDADRLIVYIRAFSGKQEDIEVLSVLRKKLHGLLIEESSLSQNSISALKEIGSLKLLSFDGSKIERASILKLKNFKQLNFLSLARTEINGKELFALGRLPLVYLNLRRTVTNGKGLSAVSPFRNLRKLVIGGKGLSNVNGEQLSFLEKLHKLESITVMTWKRLKRRDLKNIKKLERLRDVQFWGSEFERGALDGMTSSKKLEKLMIPASGAHSAGLGFLRALKKIRILRIGRTALDDNDAAAIGNLSSLKGLSLYKIKRAQEIICRLQKKNNLRSLYLGDVFMDEKGIACLGKMNELKKLNLVQVMGFSDKSFKCVKNLKKLRVFMSYDVDLDKSSLESIASLSKIHSLSIRGTKLNKKSIRKLSMMKHLRKLDVSECSLRIGNKEGRDLANTRIRTLLARGVTFTKKGVAELSANKTLKTLDISNTNIKEENLVKLSEIETLKHLLANTGTFGNRAAIEFSKRTKLLSLLIHGTILSDKGFVSLSKLPIRRIYIWNAGKLTSKSVSTISKMKHLSELRLRGAKIENRNMGKLCRCKNLWFLDLSKTNLNDSGLRKLDCLQRLRVLRIPEKTTSESVRRKVRRRLGIADVRTRIRHSQ